MGRSGEDRWRGTETVVGRKKDLHRNVWRASWLEGVRSQGQRSVRIEVLEIRKERHCLSHEDSRNKRQRQCLTQYFFGAYHGTCGCARKPSVSQAGGLQHRQEHGAT